MYLVLPYLNLIAIYNKCIDHRGTWSRDESLIHKLESGERKGISVTTPPTEVEGVLLETVICGIRP